MTTKIRGAALACALLPACLAGSNALAGSLALGAGPGPLETEAISYPPRYHAYGQDSWDFWYTKSDGLYYAYYLQSSVDNVPRFTNPTIGLATSPDLIHWTEYGEVLRANPPGQWNDAWVATGSTWWHQDRWHMVYTGMTYTCCRGVGLATSPDLKNWTKVGTGPVVMIPQPFTVPESPYWQGNGFAPGQILTYENIADPYVYPEPIDGWYYMVMSSVLVNEPLQEHGCTTLWRSQDGLFWQDLGIIAAPRLYGEMEAPSIWKHGNRWYLIFGAARSSPTYRATMVYTSDSMFGPFVPSPRSEITLPDNPGWFYVAKVLDDPWGDSVLLGGVGGTLSRPYGIVYEADGSLTLTVYDTALGQWLPDGLTSYLGPVVPDLAGGVISNGSNRINANGGQMWGPVSAAATTWVRDGFGGAIGVQVTGGDVFGTRTTVTGTQPWGPSVAICTATQSQSNPVVVPDGSGGAFYAWVDSRSGTSTDIYAQHLNSAGVATWTPDGVPVCTASGTQDAPAITVDGTGGAIIAWRDSRPGAAGGTDVYAQRCDAAGVRTWTPDGVPVSASSGSVETPVIASDNSFGAYIGWVDFRSGARDVYLQRVNGLGAPGWAVDGIPVVAAANDQLFPALAQDGAAGVFVAWEDRRLGGNNDILAQHVSPAGTLDWNSTGASVCRDFANQARPSLVTDGVGGIVVAWLDPRHDEAGGPVYHVPYVQRLNAVGSPVWTLDGVRVETTLGTSTTSTPVSIASDGVGGAFVNGTNGLHRVLPDGQLAWREVFSPAIAGVTDVPGDEGGFVRLTITAAASELAALSPPIVNYQVWRKISAASDPLPPTGWEIMMSFSPTGGPTYLVSVPTRADSSSLGPANETFSVTSHTSSPVYVLPSAVATGHSLDNLAPSAPQNLAGGNLGGGAIRLVWSPGPEADLWYYNVYRGTDPNFAPSAANRIGQPTATQWDDPNFDPQGTYYKVTAVDRHDNESPASAIAPNQIGDVAPRVALAVSYLGAFAPNPMRRAGTIEYGVAEAGSVTLGVYDLAGRQVKSLVRGPVEPGIWRASWDATDERGRRLHAGVYLVRLVAGKVHRTQKVIVAD